MRDIDWNEKLKSTPWGKNMFTEAMWDNVEKRISNSNPSRAGRLRLAIASSVLFAATVIFGLWHFPSDNQSVLATVQVVPDKFVRVDAEHYSTIMPANWVKLDIFDDPDQLGFKPSMNVMTNLDVANFAKIISTKGQEQNLLLENYKFSRTRLEFEQKMLDFVKNYGKFEIIGTFEGTNMYAAKDVAGGVIVVSYPVVNDVPFAVSLQSQEIADISQFKAAGYYDILKQVITHTFPHD